ncbi:antibiotic biosynthesis monooxygenase family protein [Polyangium jinanense]|uniref:Antibiotic biosynthesis monooxygenase n=1 Tax=Polyangium jinanense TaxID=2829994 RepID=A0A9X4AYY8_9BACT|nr:antibiotic biosynthesis monooxygenase [Polyangium jinanense]MDC3962394.1 antibiotic biosynthesis monooxygenase [Polyangium jinanense]MDC3989286.1 antibiotic biosynthesis monooxygenase [Polyangium jinanense]
MIARIDIVETDDVAGLQRSWTAAARELVARRGFLNARLHVVYKRINAFGYDLVSIVRWNDINAYYEAQASGQRLPLAANRGVALYGLVERSEFVEQPARASHLVITNAYRILQPKAAEIARMWGATRDLMAKRDGFISAELFESYHPENDTYYFVSRAEWEDEDAFSRQLEGKDYRQLVAPFEGMFQICFSRVAEEITKTG